VKWHKLLGWPGCILATQVFNCCCYCRPGLFSQAGEAVQPVILGENYTVYLRKGKKKLDVNSISAKNCTILKKFSLGKQPYTGFCYRR
jgi:hypothetical protein